MFFYVDDIVVLYDPSNQSKFEEFRDEIMKQFELRNIGELSWFLRIRVIRDRPNNKLWLSQTAYIDKVLGTRIGASFERQRCESAVHAETFAA